MAGAAYPDDASLLRALRAAEPAAFEALVRAHGGRLLAVARRFLRNEHDAQDAVQDAFLAAFRSLGGFEGGARLSTWLHRIVVNASLMKLRTRRNKPEEPIDDLLPRFLEDGHHASHPPEWQESADTLLERREARDFVRECIDRLSPARNLGGASCISQGRWAAMAWSVLVHGDAARFGETLGCDCGVSCQEFVQFLADYLSGDLPETTLAELGPWPTPRKDEANGDGRQAGGRSLHGSGRGTGGGGLDRGGSGAIGHLERFEQEALPHPRSLYGTAYRLARNAHDAEDLVQETLLRAYRAFSGFAPGTNIRAWLYTILYRVQTDAFRRAARSPASWSLPRPTDPCRPLRTPSPRVARRSSARSAACPSLSGSP